MDRHNRLIDGARITIARAIRERFPPGPERDLWLQWLDHLDPEHPAPDPASQQQIAARDPGLN